MSQKSNATNAADRCKLLMNTLLECANDAPEKLYNNTMVMASEIAKKMRLYGDALVGKANPIYVSIQDQHFRLLQRLRLQEPEKYKKLVNFATIYPTLNFNDQSKYLVSFFQDF
jgi:hypothetical protein